MVAFCDVDENKIRKGFYCHEDSQVSSPAAERRSPLQGRLLQAVPAVPYTHSLGLCPILGEMVTYPFTLGLNVGLPELVVVPVAIRWLGLPESGVQPPVLSRLVQDSHLLLDHQLL